MPTLHRFLVDYDLAMLRALAQARGVVLTTNRQPEAVDQLAPALLDPRSVQATLVRLSTAAREGLDALLAAGGRMRTPRFGRRFGPVRPLGPGRLEREAPWRKPASPAEELLYAGLIYRAFDQDEAGAGEFFMIPDDLVPLLPSPATGPAPFLVEAVPDATHYQEGGEAFLLDMFAYLAYIQNHDARPRADGTLARRDVAELSSRLVDRGERRLAFLQHLAARMGFVAGQGEYLRLEAAAVKRWLTSASSSRLAQVQEAWRDDPTWNDLRHVPALQIDQETDWRLLNDPVATRRAVLALLARCPVQKWWSVASFVTAVKETLPDFQRPDGDYTSWYIRDAASGKYLSGFESWDQVEGALLVDLLTRPLCWLGVVAINSSEGLLACRLTETGARLLGLTAGESESPPSAPIRIGADLSVEVPTPLDLYARFQLERFSDLESAKPCRYRLTVVGLGRALTRGLRVEQIVAFLQQASSSPVPTNVVAQLRLWAERFDSVQLEEVALLRTRNERVLKELTLLPETRSLIGRVLSPTTALVRHKDLPRLRSELNALGYLTPSSAGAARHPEGA